MKLLQLALPILFISCCQSWAAEQDERFVTLSAPGGKTITFDLSAVQLIQPGRFTIAKTSIDDADVMEFELKVLDALRAYCRRPDGKYSASTDVVTLGPPDLPIENIEVISSSDHLVKDVFWSYPYTRLATQFDSGKILPHQGHLQCKWPTKTEERLYSERRARITNGLRDKELFDCKRGLSGDFVGNEDNPSKAITGFVRPQSYDGVYYREICLRVTHETPYIPKAPRQ